MSTIGCRIMQAVVSVDCWVEVEWRSESFTLDVQALDRCIHVIIREPTLVRQLLSTFALSSLIPHYEFGNFVHKGGGMQLLHNLWGHSFCVAVS